MEVARIERNLIKKRLEYFKNVPTDVYEQLKEIEQIAFDVWKLDSVYTGMIMIQSFEACTKSQLTLDQLQELVKAEGHKYKSFDKAIRKFKRHSKNGLSTINILKRLNGTFASNTIKV